MADDEQTRAREAILELLRERDPGKTICPSEAARRLDGERFRELMPTVRAEAARLVDEGLIDVTQRGEVVDPHTARGAIRLRLRAGR